MRFAVVRHASDDRGFKRAINARVGELSTARKRGALRYCRARPEHPLSHECNLPRNGGGHRRFIRLACFLHAKEVCADGACGTALVPTATSDASKEATAGDAWDAGDV